VKKIGVMLLALAMVTGAASADVLIDSFNLDQSVTVTGAGNEAGNEAGPDASTVIDGYRDMWAKVTSAGGGSITVAAGNSGAFTGLDLEVSLSTGTVANTVLTWDGNDSDADPVNGIDYTGLGNEDLTESGANTGILVQITSIDLGVTIDLTAYTDSTNSSTIGHTTSSSQSIFLPFADFTGTADFTDIGAIQMKVSGTQDFDARIDLIKATEDVIPEPATMSLLGLGLLAVLRRRRRK